MSFDFKEWVQAHPADTEFYVVLVVLSESSGTDFCYACTEVDDGEDPKASPLGLGMLQLGCGTTDEIDHGIVMWDGHTDKYSHMLRADVRPDRVLTIDTLTAEQLLALRGL